MVHDVRDRDHLERLIRELAELTPKERAHVVAEAARRQLPRIKLSVPILKGGTGWVGGELRREELYGDDGR
jgi:hypothetical protein